MTMTELRKRLLDALLLSQILPDYLVAPTSIVPGADGGVSFEWHADRDNQLSVWMRDGCVGYAGLTYGKFLNGTTTERAVIPAGCMVMLSIVSEKVRETGLHNADG